jgi:hypothetical protein
MCWFTGRRKGWYEGTIDMLDEDGFNHQVSFPEGWTLCKLTRRAYGANGTWLVKKQPRSSIE